MKICAVARIVHWHLFCWFVLFLKRDKMSSKYCTILYNNILKNSHDICGLFSFVFICIFHLIKFVFYSIHNMLSWPSSDQWLHICCLHTVIRILDCCFVCAVFDKSKKNQKKIPRKKSMIESTTFFCLFVRIEKKKEQMNLGFETVFCECIANAHRDNEPASFEWAVLTFYKANSRD